MNIKLAHNKTKIILTVSDFGQSPVYGNPVLNKVFSQLYKYPSSLPSSKISHSLHSILKLGLQWLLINWTAHWIFWWHKHDVMHWKPRHKNYLCYYKFYIYTFINMLKPQLWPFSIALPVLVILLDKWSCLSSINHKSTFASVIHQTFTQHGQGGIKHAANYFVWKALSIWDQQTCPDKTIQCNSTACILKCTLKTFSGDFLQVLNNSKNGKNARFQNFF